MVKTRHGTKDLSPKEDIKDETIRTNARRHRGQPNAWQHEKKKGERKEKAYHMYNGDVDEKKMHLRSSEQEEVRHNLRYSRIRGRYSKGERSYQNQKRRSGYLKREKYNHTSPNEEEDGHERRRSGRLRRGLYGSLNERMICCDPRYQKDKVDKSGDEDSEEEGEHDKSMYDFVKKHQRQVSITPQKRRKSSLRSNKYDLENSEDTAEEEEEEEEEEGEEEEEEDDAEEEEMEEQEGQEDESQNAAAYSLRKTKPVTKRYIAPPMSVKTRKRTVSALYAVPHSPVHKASHKRIPQHSSPRHRTRKRVFGERRKHYGSSTSSSSGDSDDEVRFEKRKRKSMALARSRCLPMNFAATDVIGLIKDRERARGRGNVGSSLADIEPMSVDSKVTFESIGGLDRHIRALKEMVVFPLMYPEVFEKFKISPPRGVLFHGPPGTGKTLVARALANECGLGGHKVAFFMRKGADCLSKWVGESERQLRLLFDQAYAMRPSIIFFDEIDGLAPVRSTRQDQIHSSIVSTLLALMDGLDARGEIVVIGATNRIDSIDPALRRPGRFDREFLFTLPNCKARRQILEIHTTDWQPKLSKAFQAELANYTVGYCGADLKALCTEAALFALRRRYPQIYGTNSKLMIDVDNVRMSAKDFRNAIGTITPASQRAVVSPGRALEINVKPLLQATLEDILSKIRNLFPPAFLKESAKEIDSSTGSRSSSTGVGHVADDDDLSSEDDEQSVNIFEPAGFGRSTRRIQRLSSPPPEPPEHGFLHVFDPRHAFAVPHRPRFILSGPESNGQATHLAPAVLYAMEHLTVHVLDLPALFGVSARVPEEACAQIFREARRTAPCVIYLPHISTWWNSIGETTRATFVTLLDDLPPSAAILLMATSNSPFDYLPDRVRSLFCENASEVCEVQPPKKAEREEFFKPLVGHALQQRKSGARKRPRRILETLPVAPTPQVRQLNDAEVAELRKQEENTLRELRLFLRQITWKLMADRKFKEFSKPVDLEEVPDYLDVIKNPMDLSTVMTRINSHYYQNCAQYLEDIDLITNNCLEYNPDRDQFDRLLRNRACELRDTAYAMVEADLDPEFEKMCIEIVKSRLERGETRGFNAPSYVRCLQKNPNPLRGTHSTSSHNRAAEYGKRRSDEVQITCMTLDTERPANADVDLTGVRSSKRLKGVDAPKLEYSELPLEWKLTRERQSSTLSSRTAEDEAKSAKRAKQTAVGENGCSSVIVQDVDHDEQASLNLCPDTTTDLVEQTASIAVEENKEEKNGKEAVPETDNFSDLNNTLISGDKPEEYFGTRSSELHHSLEETLVRDAGKCLGEAEEKETIIANEEKGEDEDMANARELRIPHPSRQEQESEEKMTTQLAHSQELGTSEIPEWARNDPLLDDEKAQLEEALDHLVEKTEGFSVTSLEKIYSALSKLFYLHQHRENSYLLMSEIKNFISRL